MLRATIVQWCESGFNLVRAAAALSIHRTTLIYRLGKIEEAGLKVRDPRVALKLYLACVADLLLPAGGGVP